MKQTGTPSIRQWNQTSCMKICYCQDKNLVQSREHRVKTYQIIHQNIQAIIIKMANLDCQPTENFLPKLYYVLSPPWKNLYLANVVWDFNNLLSCSIRILSLSNLNKKYSRVNLVTDGICHHPATHKFRMK